MINSEFIAIKVKVLVNEIERIKGIAAFENDTVTNIIRSALNLYIFCWEAKRKGSKILQEDRNGDIFKITWN